MNLDDIRTKIDALDEEIIILLAKRSDLVSAAGKLKKDERGVRDPRRVEQVIGNIQAKAASAGLDPSIAEEIYRTVIDCFVWKELNQFRCKSALTNSSI